MAAWFVGGALAVVWNVFRDPAIDYRLVAAGALLPDVVDAPLGGGRYLHTLLFSVVFLAAVMGATRHRRRLRRRLLALPIGTFLHLVLDAIWTRRRLFWWPLFGVSLGGQPLPSLDHGWAVVAVEEVAGVVALAWWWRRFRLSDPARRASFLRTGRLGRDLVS